MVTLDQGFHFPSVYPADMHCYKGSSNNLYLSSHTGVYAWEVRSVWMLLWQAKPIWINKISGPHHSEQLAWCTCWNGDQTKRTSRTYESLYADLDYTDLQIRTTLGFEWVGGFTEIKVRDEHIVFVISITDPPGGLKGWMGQHKSESVRIIGRPLS